MLVSVSKAERYRKDANKYAELAKDAQPAYLGDVYRKVAVRYVFMAEELLKGPGRNGDAIDRADRMISRLRPDPAGVSKVNETSAKRSDDKLNSLEGSSLLPSVL